MKKGIVQFQDLPSIEGVVSVNQAHDFSVWTLFVDFFENVLHGFFVDVVDDNFDFVLWNLLLLKVLLNKLTCFVRRVIIDVHNVIVLVVLHEHGIKVSEVKFGFDIVVRTNNNTESQWCILILTDGIFLFVVGLLKVDNFLDNSGFFKWIVLKRRELDIDVSMKINVMNELGKENGSKLDISGHVVRLSGSFVQVIEIRVKNKVSGRD